MAVLLLLSVGESLGNVGPVEHVEDGLDVGATEVLVLEIVSVLPDVNAKEGNESGGGLEGILVLASGDLELVGRLIPPEPSPAAALDTAGLGRQLLLEGIKGAEILEIGFISVKTLLRKPC